MTSNYALFFPPGTPVLTLPNWQSPRLYLPTHHFLQRWAYSAFYPAFRFRARIYRLSLRTKAALGLGEVRWVRSNGWPLGEFARDILPQVASAVVLVGTPGPAQKITAQLRDWDSEVLGYLKYAESEAARKRLRQEKQMLVSIPKGVGPELLKFGMLGNGEALLTTTLAGTPLPAVLPPSRELIDFTCSLPGLPPISVEGHPWVHRIREHSNVELDPWFELLRAKKWRVTVQHGDFAPWNLLRRSDGALGAIDWEYGTLEGFPYLDLAHYVLQTAALVYRRDPLRAKLYAVKYLAGQPHLDLSGGEAQALTSLAAYDAYLKFREDGHLPYTNHLQRWRQAIWEAPVCGA